MGDMQLREHVRKALSHTKVSRHTDAVTAILSHAEWDTKLLSNPDYEQRLVAVLEKPWRDYAQTQRMVQGLKSEQIGAVSDAAIVIAASLIGSVNRHPPIRVNDISQVLQKRNQFLSLESDTKVIRHLWGDDRSDLNVSAGSVLVTGPVQRLVAYVKDRFVDNKSDWTGVLIRGLSGTGKSVAFALAASYLADQGLDVSYYRTPSKFNLGQWKDTFANSRSTPTIIFVDQVNQMPKEEMEQMIRLGSHTEELYVLACGSGNIRWQKSSSEVGRIPDAYEFEPSIDFEGFSAFCQQKNIADLGKPNPEPSLSRYSEMLNFHPSNFVDVFYGSRGHFLSTAKIWNFYQTMNVAESWASFVSETSSMMKAFWDSAFDENKAKLLSLIHSKLYLNDSDPKFPTDIRLDERYFLHHSIFSSLFVQAYSQAILDLKVESPELSLVQNAAVACGNNSMVGFVVERLLIHDVDKLNEVAFSCIDISGVLGSDISLSSASNKHQTQMFSYHSDMELPSSVTPDPDLIGIFHFIPELWNEESIDIMQLYTLGNTAVVLGHSVSLTTPQKHCHSLKWFSGCSQFVSKILSRGFRQVHLILLFTGSQSQKSSISVDPNVVSSCEDRVVFDYPLGRALSQISYDAFHLDLNKYSDGPRRLSVVKKGSKRPTAVSPRKGPPRKARRQG
jgi:hypothetical protein